MGCEFGLFRSFTGMGCEFGFFRRPAGVGEDVGFFGCGGGFHGVAWARAAGRVSRGNGAVGFLTAGQSPGGSARFVGCGGSSGLIPRKLAVPER